MFTNPWLALSLGRNGGESSCMRSCAAALLSSLFPFWPLIRWYTHGNGRTEAAAAACDTVLHRARGVEGERRQGHRNSASVANPCVQISWQLGTIELGSEAISWFSEKCSNPSKTVKSYKTREIHFENISIKGLGQCSSHVLWSWNKRVGIIFEALGKRKKFFVTKLA